MPTIPSNEVPQVLAAIKDLIEQNDYENAMPLTYEVLKSDPDNAAALNFLGYMQLMAEQPAFAYQSLRRALQESPKAKQIWTNFGMAAHALDRHNEALQAFLQAARLDPGYAMAYSNGSAVLVQMAAWEEAKKSAEMALECNPADRNAEMNLAHCYLAMGEWEKGWMHWDLSLGGKFRKEWVYGEEPRWDGKKGRSVVIYGEQGLGDELFYASCVPDAIRDCERVYIDCDARLEGLFARSFPDAEVHGTRLENHPAWLDSAYIEARCSIGSLPQFYRKKTEDFPRTSYLKADPDRAVMWKASFAQHGKPVIGLTFQAGGRHTNENGRHLTVEDYKPLMDRIDAVWVSLEYKDDPEGVKAYPWATKSKDYDDTAALISELDAVIGVNTTALHCAGGLGVPTICLVPTWHQWRYAIDPMPWYGSMELWYQRDNSWQECIRRLSESRLLEKFRKTFKRGRG